MKKHKIRGIIILVVLLVTLYYFLPLIVPDLPGFWTEKRLNLGLDLQGGTQLQLEVDFSEVRLSESEREEAVRSALEIIRNRIDQFGVAEPSIQRSGSNRIMVQLPGLDDPERAKELIGRTAMLEFKLVATSEKIEETYNALNEYLKHNHERYDFLEEFTEDVDDDEMIDILADDEEIEDLGVNDRIFTALTTAEGRSGLVEYRHLDKIRRLLGDEEFQKQIPTGLQILLGKENREDPYAAREIYVLRDRAELTGQYLDSAAVRIGEGYDPRTAGKPYVALNFNREGARIFANVTGQNIQRRLAIVLDDVVYVAPTIQDRIPGGEAQITGEFTMQETQDLVIVLRAGNLPAPVNIIEERTVGPTLGSDSIRAGILAAIIGMCIVVLFMLIYYKLSGLIANIALLVNICFIIAVLTMLEGTLTMPGIAGMILTIGMAVDANVIIFERIRENLKSGKTVRTAVDGGFSRALVTILDANITTLITAIVLYQFGTGPIRGFAVTLSIGIIGSMFAALILGKAIFDTFITNIRRERLSI